MLTRMNDISRMRLFIVDLRPINKSCCHLSTRSIGRQPVRLCRSLLYIFAPRLSTPIHVFTFCQRNLGHRFQRKSLSRSIPTLFIILLPEETMILASRFGYMNFKKWCCFIQGTMFSVFIIQKKASMFNSRFKKGLKLNIELLLWVYINIYFYNEI